MWRLVPIAYLLTAGIAEAVPVVENGEEPAHGRRTVRLDELWRIGGLDDEENLLGIVSRVVADAEGNLYLLDTQLVQVLVHGPDGELVRTLGREGEGPGELRRPRDVVLLPDGTVGLVQGFPGRIVKVDREGLPAGELHPGGDPQDGSMFALNEVVSTGGHLVMTGVGITRDDTHRTAKITIASYNTDGHRQAVYHARSNARELTSFHRVETEQFTPRAWDVGADGRVWLAPHRDEYRIDVHAPDGTLLHTIYRDYEPWRRTDEEIEHRRWRMTPWGGRNRNRVTVEVAPTERDIMQLHLQGERLWVLSSRGAHPDEPGIHSVWDVFDADGRFDEQVALACEGVAMEDAVFLPGQGLVVVVKGSQSAWDARRGQDTGDGEDEDAVPLEVICYRLPR